MRILKNFIHPIAFLLLTLLVFSFFCFFSMPLHHNVPVRASEIILFILFFFFIAYRYYSQWIAKKILKLDPHAITPAVYYNDGLDYVPTQRFVLLGHHFAAIAGAGPLIGPILALQMGYFPGILWLLFGVIFAGAVQDFIVLTISMRHGGSSLGQLIKRYLGPTAGILGLISTFLIIVILLSVLALIVVKALTHSPWSLFTVSATLPIALLMGVYLEKWRPGKIAEVSGIGVFLLIVAIIAGQAISRSTGPSAWFDHSGTTLSIALMGYGFLASILPVWLLLAPRDYLSTFLKLGTMILLALAMLWVNPILKMPAYTPFIHGNGPVWSGDLFPFLFITIACGAVSGFHALIASGTTPKMIAKEQDARLIGYGGMLLEAFVAFMALLAAASLEPGIYFALNSPAALIGSTVETAAHHISHWGFMISPEQLENTAHHIGEITILSRSGGAPTLAIAMADILSKVSQYTHIMGFWYHFAILFEALFILTALDAGTRVGRFILQDLLGHLYAPLGNTHSWVGNLLATSGCVGAWGYFLYMGITDPLGGIYSLWPLFGIANQILAAIALILASVFLLKTKQGRFAWITILPTLWLLACTLSASYQKLLSTDIHIGFLAHATHYRHALLQNIVLQPAQDVTQMRQMIHNDYIDAILTLLLVCIVIFLLIRALWLAYQYIRAEPPTEAAALTATWEKPSKDPHAIQQRCC
jgi:carbon starvation protein